MINQEDLGRQMADRALPGGVYMLLASPVKRPIEPARALTVWAALTTGDTGDVASAVAALARGLEGTPRTPISG